MSQIETAWKKPRVICGAVLVAATAIGVMAGVVLAGSAGTADAAMATYRVVGTSEEGVLRLDAGTGEISVCTVDLGGTLSCAATDGL